MDSIAQFINLLLSGQYNPILLLLYVLILAFVGQLITWLFSRDSRKTVASDLAILQELEDKRSKDPEDKDLEETVSVLRRSTLARVRKFATRKDAITQFIKLFPLTSFGALALAIALLLTLADGGFDSLLADFGLSVTFSFVTICCTAAILLFFIVDLLAALVRLRLVPFLKFKWKNHTTQIAIRKIREQIQNDFSFNGRGEEMLRKLRLIQSNDLEFWMGLRKDLTTVMVGLEASIKTLISIKTTALNGRDELDELISEIQDHASRATSKRLPTLKQQRGVFMETIAFADSYLPQYNAELQIEKEMLEIINERIDEPAAPDVAIQAKISPQ